MKRIIHRELLEIFSHTEAAEDDAKDTAFGEFAEELTGYCRQEKNLAERTRTGASPATSPKRSMR